MDAQGWVMVIGALVTLVGAIGAAVAVVVKAIKDNHRSDQNPDVEGSGAAIVAELKASRQAQERFNAALALHLGMGDDREPARLRPANGR